MQSSVPLMCRFQGYGTACQKLALTTSFAIAPNEMDSTQASALPFQRIWRMGAFAGHFCDM